MVGIPDKFALKRRRNVAGCAHLTIIWPTDNDYNPVNCPEKPPKKNNDI